MDDGTTTGIAGDLLTLVNALFINGLLRFSVGNFLWLFSIDICLFEMSTLSPITHFALEFNLRCVVFFIGFFAFGFFACKKKNKTTNQNQSKWKSKHSLLLYD